ncbi:MAG: glycosyltransferase domain-containing protein [Methylophilaceae bacterium]
MSTHVLVENTRYDTLPVIHHCPEDHPQKIWNTLVKLKGDCSDDIQKPKNLTVITFNNQNEEMLLERRLNASKSEFLVLGKGLKEWRNPMKIELLKEGLQRVQTEYVLVMDASDVVISGSLARIVVEFKKFECEVLYNASSYVYPAEDRYSVMEDKIYQGLFSHLNSGCFIGRTNYCLNLYREVSEYSDEITERHHYSDQIKIKPFYIKNYPKIKIDTMCEIFQIWNVKGMNCSDILKIRLKIHN